MESPAQLIDAAERNYLAAWATLASRANGGEVEDTGDILFATVRSPIAFFNSAFVRPAADPLACIERVRAFFDERERPFTLRFREPDSPAVAQACEAAGLTSTATSPLMTAAVDDIGPPSTVDIRPVDASSWHDYISTLAEGFAIPIELLTAMIDPALVEVPEFAGFTAYVDGEPASTAAVFVSDDVAGIYNVATPERFRRAGLGEATTRAAVAEGARRGCVLTTLQASEMGYPIYERMGYRTAVRWLNFTG
jgi:GNAT superfamily N-acetyltransferase